MNRYQDLSREQSLTALDTFAATIDPRIKTRCLRCPPDAPAGKYCGWEFYLEE